MRTLQNIKNIHYEQNQVKNRWTWWAQRFFELNIPVTYTAWPEINITGHKYFPTQVVAWNLTSLWSKQRNMELQHIYRTASSFKVVNSLTEVIKRQHRFFWITPKCQKPSSQGVTHKDYCNISHQHSQQYFPQYKPFPPHFFRCMRNTFPVLSYDFLPHGTSRMKKRHNPHIV